MQQVEIDVFEFLLLMVLSSILVANLLSLMLYNSRIILTKTITAINGKTVKNVKTKIMKKAINTFFLPILCFHVWFSHRGGTFNYDKWQSIKANGGDTYFTLYTLYMYIFLVQSRQKIVLFLRYLFFFGWFSIFPISTHPHCNSLTTFERILELELP